MSKDLFKGILLFRVTADQLSIATDGYSESNLIGIGGSSKVYKGILPDGKFVAVKKFNLEGNYEEVKSIFDKECETLGKIRHRNLVSIVSTCCNLELKALVLEFMPNGNLEQHLFGGEHGLEWERVFNIAVDVANALAYLHHECSVPVLHCDLKPNNILLDEDFTAHVADFGIAQLLTPNTTTYSATHFRGSIGYAAPECAELSHYSTKGDVYSYGVVLLCMLTRKRPTSDLFDNGMDLPKWVKAFFSERFLDALHPTLRAEVEAVRCELEVLDLMKVALMCTERTPSDRPTARQVLNALQQSRNAGLKHLVSVKVEAEQEGLRKFSYHLVGDSSVNTS